jgi:hypothetical protein
MHVSSISKLEAAAHSATVNTMDRATFNKKSTFAEHEKNITSRREETIMTLPAYGLPRKLKARSCKILLHRSSPLAAPPVLGS